MDTADYIYILGLSLICSSALIYIVILAIEIWTEKKLNIRNKTDSMFTKLANSIF